MTHFNNSVEDIKLECSLDYLSLYDANVELSKNVEWLCHGGTITVQGLDLDEIARALHFRFLDVDSFNELASNRKSYSSLENRKRQLEALGLRIVKQRLNNYHYFIEAKRP